MNRRTILGLCVSALLLIAFLVGVMIFERAQAARERAYLATASSYTPTTTTPPTTTAPAPALAPEFSVIDEENEIYTLSDFIGKPLVLCFWNADNQDSRQELVVLSDLQEQYPDTLTVAAIHVTGDKAAALSYLQTEDLSIPVYFDESGEAAKAYSINEYPTTYFIDKDGVLKARSRGNIDASDIPTALERIGLQ